MKKVQTKNRTKGIFGIFATFALAVGVGVSLAPKDPMQTKAAEPTTVVVTRDDFAGGSGYAEGTWSKGGFEGVGFIYFTTTTNIQVSTNAGRRPYPYNSTGTPGPITNISVTMPGTGSLRDLTPRVSSTAAVTTEESGTALAKKTFESNSATLSWDISLSDNIRYFQLVPGGNTNWASFSFTYEEVEEVEFETLTSLELDSSNAKTEFYTTETFNNDDLVVIAKDQNGTSKIIELDEVTTNFDGVIFDESHLGTQEVEVSYEEGDIEVSATYEIEVEEMPDYALFTKITSSEQLVLGGQYVIAGDKAEVTWTMSTIQGTNNRTAILATKVGGKIQETEDTQVFVLEEGTESGSFAFKSVNGTTAGQYIYSAGGGGDSTNNYLKSQTTLDADGSWKITFDGGELTEVKSQGTANRNVLRLNSSSALFSSYGSGQTLVSLYLDETSIDSGDAVYEEAKDFADWLLAVPESEACADKFAAAQAKWDLLSAEAKALFKSDAEFQPAKNRLLQWALANELSSLDDLDTAGVGVRNPNVKNNNSLLITITILIGVIALTTLSGIYFIKKRQTHR